MSNTVIQVENISKKYIIGHQRHGEGLRHILNDAIIATGDCLIHPFRKKISRPDIEEFWALKDVSFDVKKGERIGIIGRNGAGKSTLLKILSRITEPTFGRVLIHGRVASLLEIGTGFHPELTGRENVFLNGAILGMTKQEIKRKFDEIIAFSEIEKFLDTPVKRYSSGMYVRLAFAVAAHLEPEILLVDEVLAVGDVEFQKKCLGKMNEISGNGERTIVFVSHNMSAITRLCNKVVVFDRGIASLPMKVDKAIEIYLGKSRLSSGIETELSGLKREILGMGDICKFEKAFLSKANGLIYGEPFEINFIISCQHSVYGIGIGVGFDTLEGQRILSIDSDNNGKRFDLIRGRYLITLKIDVLLLHPARYSISAAILPNYDWVKDFCSWEIMPGNPDYISNRGFGGCRLEPVFSIKLLN